MRALDRWAGIPVCFLLTVLRKCTEFTVRGRRPHTTGICKILFVKLAEQGATVLAYPSIQKAVARVGSENVYFLVFEQNRFILDALNVIPRQNVVAISTGTFLSLATSAISSLRRLRKLRMDSRPPFCRKSLSYQALLRSDANGREIVMC